MGNAENFFTKKFSASFLTLKPKFDRIKKPVTL